MFIMLSGHIHIDIAIIPNVFWTLQIMPYQGGDCEQKSPTNHIILSNNKQQLKKEIITMNKL